MELDHLRSSAVLQHLAQTPAGPTLDVFGGTVEFVSWSAEFCVMRAVLPPGGVVALHRHPDAEDFLILSGRHQVLVSDGDNLAWRDAVAGDYVRIPGNVMHAHRNVDDEPAVDLVVTTPKLGRFFLEIGRPATDSPQPRTSEEVAQFVATSIEYGYVLGTPEENAAVGIDLPAFTS
ncbi:cupin domain-containing protein [Mycobacterium asiaticum]|uniref:Cupin n=1 Tax=Mycobacterium asiaticum TaxID=1790 RepID=A0A1A3KYL9_MYCAS|nr:cupin domain-containing protein [Mycobacterium asiaticum]OBJ90085.1 cupin [Mycobacterium asiaticum]